MKLRRCIVLIDGSNFYFKLKDLGLHHLLEFDFLGFAKLLSSKKHIVFDNKGGIRGQILNDGEIRVGSIFEITPPPQPTA